ncbi:hypothetical protein B4589_009425 [Halolamina sp. CBA1230]|uniref:hypothetical protein n=1 Tax=Halolamina sp. CBA1230 TaxID=1853690 RepID=UPI0009A21C5B|nr:hypothetical protein [Halolamina sp. CBA1230]QKY20586.1 hypothetical protein B4589_009425 [Halolamina sp. CBA1230]
MTPLDLLLVGLLVVICAAMGRDAARTGWSPRYLLGSALVLGGLVGTFFLDDLTAAPLPGWTEFVFAVLLLVGFVLQWSGREAEP